MKLRCQVGDLAVMLPPSPNFGAWVTVEMEGDEPGDWIVKSLQSLVVLDCISGAREVCPPGTLACAADSALQPIRGKRGPAEALISQLPLQGAIT